MPPWMQAAQDGAAARRRGEPRDPTPYLARYEGLRGLRNPRDAWLVGYDQEDERLAFEQSRPNFAGQDLWQAVKRGEAVQWWRRSRLLATGHRPGEGERHHHLGQRRQPPERRRALGQYEG
jgi:hypothetical protein